MLWWRTTGSFYECERFAAAYEAKYTKQTDLGVQMVEAIILGLQLPLMLPRPLCGWYLMMGWSREQRAVLGKSMPVAVEAVMDVGSYSYFWPVEPNVSVSHPVS